MADFPVVSDSASSQEDIAVTTHMVSLPPNIEPNEMLLVGFAIDGEPDLVTAWTTGWYKQVAVRTVGGNAMLLILLRYADGTEGSSITVTTSTTRMSVHWAYRIGCYERHAAPQYATDIPSGTTPSGPLLDPRGWGTEEILWINAVASDSAFVTAFPADYPDNQINRFNSDIGIEVCTRSLEAASEDPGPYTVNVSTNNAAATIAIRPIQDTPCPSFVGRGTPDGSSSGGITVTLPDSVVPDDINLFFTAHQSNSGPLSGWSEVAGSPVEIPLVDPDYFSIWWRRHVDGDPTTITVNPPLGFRICQIASFRGCPPSGDPWDVTETGTETTSDTSVSIPGDTTTGAGRLVIASSSVTQSSAGGSPVQDTHWSGWTNSDLANLEEILDVISVHIGGDGFGAAIGEKYASGAYGATTATIAEASKKGLFSIALKPDTSLVSPGCDIHGFQQIFRWI